MFKVPPLYTHASLFSNSLDNVSKHRSHYRRQKTASLTMSLKAPRMAAVMIPRNNPMMFRTVEDHSSLYR